MCLGDSLTDLGQGDGNGGVATKSTVAPQWGPNPIPMGMALAKNCYQVRSGGLAGQTSRTMCGRLFSDMMTRAGGLPLGNVIHLLYGTNDYLNAITVKETQANMMWAVTACIEHGYQPIVGTLPPRSDYAYGATWTGLNAAILAYNSWARSVFPPMGVPVLDYYSAVADSTGNWVNYGPPGGVAPAASYSSDGVHWNNPGGAFAGAVAAASVYKGLGWPPIYLAQQDWLLNPNNETLATFFEHPLCLNNGAAWSNTQGTGAWATNSETVIPASGAAPGYYYHADGTAGAVTTFTIEPGLLPNGAQAPGNYMKAAVVGAAGNASGFPTNDAVIFDRNFGNPPKDANAVAVNPNDLMYFACRMSMSNCRANNGASGVFINTSANTVSPCQLWNMDNLPAFGDMVVACEFQLPNIAQTVLEAYVGLVAYANGTAWSGTLYGTQPTMIDMTLNGLVPGTNW